jgi:hypothetical protein
MELTKQKKDFYAQTREQCKAEVLEMNQTMKEEWAALNREIARVQALIQDFENKKQIIGQMHASACMMLGVADDLDISPAITEE